MGRSQRGLKVSQMRRFQRDERVSEKSQILRDGGGGSQRDGWFSWISEKSQSLRDGRVSEMGAPLRGLKGYYNILSWEDLLFSSMYTA